MKPASLISLVRSTYRVGIPPGELLHHCVRNVGTTPSPLGGAGGRTLATRCPRNQCLRGKHIKKHKKYVFLFFYVSSPTVIPKPHKHINLFFYCYFLCVYVFMWLEFPRAYPVPPWKHKHISTYFMCLCGQVYVYWNLRGGGRKRSVSRGATLCAGCAGWLLIRYFRSR